MPDKVELNRDLGIIEVTSYGVVTGSDISDSVDKIDAFYRETGIPKVMVDTTRQEKMPGTVGIFKLFSSMPLTITFVLLVKEKQLTEEDLLFAETVAVNRGVRMKIFYDKEKGLEWLKNA